MNDKHPSRPAWSSSSGSGLASRSTAPGDRRSAFQHPEQIGRYEVHADPEVTDSSFVYEGWDPALERKVAIKAMRLPDGDDEETEEARLRFQRSARAASTFHPNIVSVYDYLEVDHSAYIVMEFVEGGSLKDRIEQRRPFTAAEIATIMNDLLSALSYSHRMGIVHRDIKPANILLSAEGRWKLTDFGIARFRSSVATRIGTFMGTPAYSSLEQIRTEPVDNRTDIYSCGVVLYELLTGQRPFRGSEETVRRKIQDEVPAAPSSINHVWTPQLDRVVAKAMAKHRDDRFTTVEEFQVAFQKCLNLPQHPDVEPVGGDSTIVFRPEQRVARSTATTADRINYPLIGAIAGGVLLLVGAGAMMLRSFPGQSVQKVASVASPPHTVQPVPSAPSPPTPPRVEASPPAPEQHATAAPVTNSPPPSAASPSYSPVAPTAEPLTRTPDDYTARPPAVQEAGQGASYPPYQPPAAPAIPAYRPALNPPPSPSVGTQATRPPPVAHLPKPPEKPAPTAERNPPARVQLDQRPPPNGVQNLADEIKPNEARPGDNRRGDNKQVALAKPATPPVLAETPPAPAPAPAPTAAARDFGVFCGPVAPDTPNLPETTDPAALLKVIGAAQGLAGFNAGIRTGDLLAKGGGLSTRADGYASCLISPAGEGRSVALKVWRDGRWRTVSVQAN